MSLQNCREFELTGSHPGYGCWLSGIDVDTESNYQRYNDPYLAVVIDPNRTVSAGKVEIGAFRTYPEVSPFYNSTTNPDQVGLHSPKRFFERVPVHPNEQD